MKANKFEEIISLAIARVKPVLSSSQAAAFDQMISALPKRIKEFNAEPYLFIFQAMLRRKELVEPALSAFATMLEENYITAGSYDRLASALAPIMKEHAYATVQAILRIKEPHLEFFRLYFEVHNSVALPEDLFRRFKAVAYGWLARAFAMTQRELPQFEAEVYAKFAPEEMPKLAKPEEEEREVRRYVGLVLIQAVEAVEAQLQGPRARAGKHGFCFLCKQPADYYCKDTRVPVCGVDCKKSHLQMLARSNALNGHYPLSFLQAIQELLVSNLHRRQSPALSMDFLIAIYCYSAYVPQAPLPHARVLALPVIYERTWMLYLAYFGKLGLLCEHVLASCLTAPDQYTRSMANEYFLRLAGSSRFLRVYAAFDRAGRARLTDFLLRSLEEARRGEFIQALVGTLFNAYTPNSRVYDHNEMALVRAFNHEKDLSVDNLPSVFGKDPQRKLIGVILRNELAINREKLGEFLYANEEVLREFLRAIVKTKKGAPIDQLLRQIFYFINVKISDKIYRLFQILSEVYTPSPPFDDMNFFTYAYFVIMVVTELNNPAITTKPTLSSVLNRVQQFSPPLAKQHPQIIEGMFQRISAFPFSQQSRGVLSHYAEVPNGEVGEDVRAEEVVIENNELIYEVVIACVPDVLLLYRLCRLTTNHPAICQVFLQLLVDKLPEEPRDPFLLEAISSILEQQPNAAGCLWRQILEDRPGPGQPSFSIQHLILASSQLTDSNFRQFVRELCEQLPLTAAPEQYLSLLALNKTRISLALPLIAANYDRCPNLYLRIAFLKRLGQFLEGGGGEGSLVGLLRRLLEELPVLPITEGLLAECAVSMRLQGLGADGEGCWRAFGKKCLQVRNEKTVRLLEGFLRRGGESFYESYLIQKTLNCCQKEHISLQILSNLRKLEPYIKQIRPDLLRMFVREQNLEVIMRFLECFCRFNSTHHLILQQWNAYPQWMDHEKITCLLNSIKSLLQQGGNVLELYHLPRMLVALLGVAAIETTPLLKKYVNLIKFKKPQEEEWFAQLNTAIIVNFNILTESLTNHVLKIAVRFKEDQKRQGKEEISDLVSLLDTMHLQARSFQVNIPLRLEMRKLLRVSKPQAPLPSLLDSSISLLRALLTLQDLLQHPSEPSLMRVFHAAEAVIDRHSQLAQVGPGVRKDSVERVALVQASREALQYGEVAIESAQEFLQLKGQLSIGDKATMKRILIGILIQGYFNEQTGSFQALAGSQLANKVNHIFHLLK